MSENTPVLVDFENTPIHHSYIRYKPSRDSSTQEVAFDNGDSVQFLNLSASGVEKIKVLYEESKKGNGMSKYRNIKIHVPTPEISEAIQKKLFEDGCLWSGSNHNEPKYIDRQYLYVSSRGSMQRGDYECTFADATEKEVHYQSILDPLYDVKIAWANGEVVQYRVKGDDDWIDWNPKASIHIGRGEDWRVKPKTKTIKQWERKFWDGLYVCTMKSLDKTPRWSENLNWIGEAYEAEYEVPND